MTEITTQLSTALADRYRIESHLGEGGMATVYLAQDLKHDRKVALKVLRPELAAVIGGERFLQEIKVTANLQHPHILPLHDSGEAGSFLYYVMPYVEGDTLRDKLSRERQLDIDEAVELTRDVASALDYAHRQGVIHRDIKPENILIHDGQPLVADFGIALAVSHASGQRLTETGLSIGTPHYMSPEQAMGDRELDARSDVYSLGAMLYEMLTGDPPYTGTSAQAIVAKVITEKAPPVTAARDTVPSHVAAAVGKALQKMPADRFRSAADFANALVNPGFATSVPAVSAGTTVPAAARRTVPVWLFAAMALLAVGAVALLGLRGLMGGPPGAVTRFTVDLGDELPVAPTRFDRLAISPDGSRIAMLVQVEGEPAIALRALDQLDVTVLPRTEDARNPTFSPDNQWLAFLQDGAIRKVRLAGGTPLTLVEEAAWTGLSWGKDGTIVFAVGEGLRRIPEAGGPVETLTTTTQDGTHSYPDQLPNGRGVVFTVGSSNDDARIAVVDIASGVVTELLEGVRARYVSTGHLVYASADGGLLAAPFDQDRLAVVGAAVPLLEGVSVSGLRSARFAVAENGTLVYQTGAATGAQIVRVERDGTETVVVAQVGDYSVPRYSPDGSRVAVEFEDDIWLYDVAGGTSTRLTVEGENYTPLWSPDGIRIAFGSVRAGDEDIWWRVIDGSAPAERLVETPGEAHPGGWTPDGRRLVYRTFGEGTARDLWTLTLEGDSGAVPYLATEFEETGPVLSPDGGWVAYQSSETGRSEVYVRAFPESGGRVPVSTQGGVEPLWSRDGTELYYRAGGNLMAAEVQLTPTFRVIRRRVLFGTPGYRVRLLHAGYDVHPDGSFLFVKEEQVNDATTTVVLNWLEELKEAVGR